MLQALTFDLQVAKPIYRRLALMLIIFLLAGALDGKGEIQARPLHLAAGLMVSASDSGQASPEATPLELGKPIERQLAGGEQHRYQLTLNQGQYANILVAQNGIDVAVKLLGADGKVMVEFDGEVRAQGREIVELIADTTGPYRLSVEALQRNAHGRYEIQVVTLREATEKDRQLQEARKAFTASGQLRRAGNLSEAFKQAERALEIRERELGAEHLEVALTLDTVAFFYFRKGELGKAESLVRRALAIKEKTLEPGHPEIAQTLNSLGLVMEDQGDLVQAEALYKRALEIRERAFGPDHTAVAASLNSLAGIYMEWQDYARAEPIYRRSLELKEKLIGPDSPSVADSLNNLSLVSRNLGDYEKAEAQLLKALSIYEKALGVDHPALTTMLINLALVYNEKEEYGKSEQALRRGLEIAEKKLGLDQPTVAKMLYNLGNVYFYQDDLARAEPLYLQALAILEKRLGTTHSDLAFPLRSLGGLYRLKGDYDKAQEFFRRALEVREKAFGPNHPSVGETLSSLSILYAAKGDAAQAVEVETRVNELAERNVSLNLITGSDLKKLAYLSSLSEKADRTISLGVRVFPDQLAARRLAATAILLRKGRVQDAMIDSLRLLRSRFNEEDKKFLDELNRTTAQLAQLVLNGPQQMPLSEHESRIKKLEEQRENLESEISRRSAGYYEKPQSITLAAVQSAIPADAALIDFALYRPFEFKGRSKEKELGEQRYVVYVLRPDGDLQFADLGEAKNLQVTIDQLRSALRDPKRKDIRGLARTVDEKIMHPVRAFIGAAKHLLISPEGALNLIPFEALVDERGQYLIENYSFTYLSSGRDLLRLQVARASKSEAVVVADPLFGEPLVAEVGNRDAGKTKAVAPAAKRQSLTTGSDLSSVYFAPLGGTIGEAQAIKSLFSEARLLTGTAATESAVKQVRAPSILHIATHGFFLTDRPAPASTAAEGARAINAQVKIENPLLRSGLALAGANLKGNKPEDGVLTALEAASLNLWGTKLVTLSACDTGLGEVKNGEGVYGLRRAFMLAGAESLVMSLWAVSDYVTREMMTAYYKNLKQGLGRGEALRQVQLAMFKRKGREHPFYWASFIQAGEWANLDGKRP